MANNNEPITCKYLPIYFGNQYRFYPMVAVRLHAGEVTETVALVDSGATNTFVPYDLAEAIDLFPKDKKKIRPSETTGASGKFKTYTMPLKRLDLLKGIRVFETFHDLSVYVPTEEQRGLPHVVLGRDYIFKHFDISFCENRKRIEFKRRKV